MKSFIKFMLVILLIVGSSSVSQSFSENNPLFQEQKIKNYLPHMSWKDIEEALVHTDIVIIPVGSIEQHGPHMPLGTDFYWALNMCLLIAQETDILVAPALMVGLAEYHMGFPGTMTLTPETFEAVLYESSQCLLRHGFKKILFLNGHGGNTDSMQHVIRKINQTTSASALMLNGLQTPTLKDAVQYPQFDWHAGEKETSEMLYLTPGLVDMNRAEKPILSFPPNVQKSFLKSTGQSLFMEVAMSGMFCPEDTGKNSSSRELTNNGVFTDGDPANAKQTQGKAAVDHFVKAAVQFIEEWKK